MESKTFKRILIILFALLIVYLTLNGDITADRILDIFKGLTLIGG